MLFKIKLTWGRNLITDLLNECPATTIYVIVFTDYPFNGFSHYCFCYFYWVWMLMRLWGCSPWKEHVRWRTYLLLHWQQWARPSQRPLLKGSTHNMYIAGKKIACRNITQRKQSMPKKGSSVTDNSFICLILLYKFIYYYFIYYLLFSHSESKLQRLQRDLVILYDQEMSDLCGKTSRGEEYIKAENSLIKHLVQSM